MPPFPKPKPEPPPVILRLRDSIAAFIRTEAASGVLLLGTAALPFIAANSGLESV